ncbi:hypothetical protein ACEPAH_3842 [Sanghuangporus vaninii]
MGDNVGKAKRELDPKMDFIAGTVAGVAGLTIAHPFDTVKVRLQNPEVSSKYRSTFHAFSTVIREERFRGLYKGIASPMLSCAPLNGLVFASYHSFMRMQLKHPDHEPTIQQIGLAGVGTGIVSSSITCPIELIKIRQQNIVDRQPSAREVALDIIRKNGIRGLYRGIVPTALRDFGYGAYFATYEAACRYFSRGRPQIDPPHPTVPSSLLDEAEKDMVTLSWPALLFSGALAGVTGWIATFPFDVVKTRVQSVDRSSEKDRASHPYRNTLSTIINSYRSEGVACFFRGLTPTIIRAIPVNMATFGIFELMVNLLSF